MVLRSLNEVVKMTETYFYPAFHKLSVHEQLLTLETLEFTQQIELLNTLRPDELALILRNFDCVEQKLYLSFIHRRKSREVLRLLMFKKDEVASILIRDRFVYDAKERVSDVFYHEAYPELVELTQLFIVDEQNRLLGTVETNELLQTNRNVYLTDLMQAKATTVLYNHRQKEVRDLLSQDKVNEAAVISSNNILLGVVLKGMIEKSQNT